MAYVPPSPKLVRTNSSSTASKAQNTAQQLAALLPTTTTILSPVEVYQPGTSTTYVSQGGIVGPGGSTPAAGVWTAPDVNGDGSAYQVLVEAFGGGGGGGGGSASTGGGGGGGGEYALEQTYLVEPGQSYVWLVGQGGSPGAANSTPSSTVGTGTDGSVTMFDVAGLSPTGNGNGVQAEGGTGGDAGTVGLAGAGGTGSSNTLNYDGGPGGTNSSGNASDNPIAFVAINNATYWTPHPAPSNAISRWLVMNDASGSSTINDQSFNDLSASVTVYQPGGFTLAGPTAAPAQAPAFLGGAGTYGPNATIENGVAQFALVSLNQASARITNTSFGWGNAHQTFSGWIQCDPTGTWGNTAAGSVATISSNSQNVDTVALKGFAVYLFNAGTATSPNWEIVYAQGNGSSRYSVVSPLAPIPGAWYYVVATYNSGTMTLYVNGSSAGTAATNATFTTPPGGSFNMTLGTNPGNTGQYFFGYMSNFWWAEGATAGTGLISAADGVTPATGGAGGGSGADAGGIGGEGIPAVTTVGGAGGTALALPASLASVTTAGVNGIAGANAGASNFSASATVAYGAGGGGAGNKAAPPAVLTAPYNLPTAASYCGTDATGGNATVLYSPAQQGTTTQLFQGGQGSDPSSGTKNAVILLPPGLSKLFPSATYTILACTLTLNNAIPGAAQPVILEIGASSDTSLASTWDGTHSLGNMGYLLVPAGAGAVTYDLLPTGFPALLQAGTAGAITLGPAATPTFESYAGTTAGSFYGSVYGPGSYDTNNNYLGPQLEVTYVLTSQVPNRGSWGGPGFLRVAQVDNSHIPVSSVQAFATTDGAGNKFAQGYTGDSNAFDPTVTTPGQFVPETWKLVGGAGNPPFLNSWANQGGTFASLQFKRTSGMETRIVGVINGTSATNGWVFTLPTAYCPKMDFEAPLSLRGAPNASGTYLRVTASTGEVQIVNFQSIGYGVDVSIPLDVTS